MQQVNSDEPITPAEQQAIMMWVRFACAHVRDPWSAKTKADWAALPRWAKGL